MQPEALPFPNARGGHLLLVTALLVAAAAVPAAAQPASSPQLSRTAGVVLTGSVGRSIPPEDQYLPHAGPDLALGVEKSVGPGWSIRGQAGRYS